MVSLLLLGKLMHRQGSAPRVLLFTAVLMLMHNPKILVFDASFQLSFLAVLGLIYGAPIVQGFVEKIFPAHGRASGHSRETFSRLSELVSTTLATQIFVFPFLLYNMGNFSLVFLLSNLLILPVLPFVMLIGFVATLVAFVLPVLSWPIAFISHLLLSWILWVAEFFGELPFASIEIENFPLWGSLILYVGLATLLWKKRSLLGRPQSERL
jgi:ComEC/Rec2-related protein